MPHYTTDASTNAVPCWYCGKTPDAQTTFASDGTPSAGDVSVCLNCAAIGFYMADGRVATPTESQLHSMAQQPEVLKIVATVVLVHQVRRLEELRKQQ